MPDEDPRIGALYGLPYERFVPERDALAKALRAEGDRDAAAAVKKLPKPTQPAWAVNIAVRDDPAAVEALADAARTLQEAQEELLSGGDASVLRAAAERARTAVDALAAAAPEGSAATAEKVHATLHAATVEPEVLAEVVAGRVVRERVASGFGGLAAGAAAIPARPARSPRDRPRSAKPAPTRGRGRERERRRPERDTGAEQRRKAAAAEKERERAEGRRRQKLEKARAEEAEAEQAVEAARRALEQVERALDERRAQVRDAQAAAREARRRRER